MKCSGSNSQRRWKPDLQSSPAPQRKTTHSQKSARMHFLHSESGFGTAPTACLVSLYNLTASYFITATLLSKMWFLFSPFFSTAFICFKRNISENSSAWLSRGWMGFGRFSLDTKAFLIILNQTNGCSERVTKTKSSCYELQMALQITQVERSLIS